MRTTLKAFSFFLVGALAFVALLTPTTTSAQETELGQVNISVNHCTDLDAPGPLTEVGDDCVPGPASFDFYFYGDGTDDALTIPVDESGVFSQEIPVGTYAVHETTGDTPVGDVVVSADAPLNIIWGIPREAPAPEPEMATLAVATYACEGVVGDPVVLGEIGPDCTQVASNLSFYLWGDGTDDSLSLTTSADGLANLELPVGGYDVINEDTQETVGVQVPSGNSTVAIGYAADIEPEPVPSGTLNINTVMCEGVEEPMLTDAIDEDCDRVGKVLTIYMFGDGTDDHVSVTTDNVNTIAVDLPVGEFEIVDEASQARFAVVVNEGVVTDVNIAYPWQEVDEDDPVPPVTELPETGVGAGSSLSALPVMLGGAILA